jgi:hypothetical protein
MFGGNATPTPTVHGRTNLANFALTSAMIRYFVARAHDHATLVKPRIIVSVPTGTTDVERRAVRESAEPAEDLVDTDIGRGREGVRARRKSARMVFGKGSLAWGLSGAAESGAGARLPARTVSVRAARHEPGDGEETLHRLQHQQIDPARAMSEEPVLTRLNVTVGKPATPRLIRPVTSESATDRLPVSSTSQLMAPLAPPWWLISTFT